MINLSTIKKLNVPFVESPIFKELILSRKKNKLSSLAKSFNKNGYVVIDLNLSKNYLNHVIKDILGLKLNLIPKKIRKFTITMKAQELLRDIKNLNS